MTDEEIRKYTQRLPARLHDFASEEAYRRRMSLNEYIISLVEADSARKNEQSSNMSESVEDEMRREIHKVEKRLINLIKKMDKKLEKKE